MVRGKGPNSERNDHRLVLDKAYRAADLPTPGVDLSSVIEPHELALPSEEKFTDLPEPWRGEPREIKKRELHTIVWERYSNGRSFRAIGEELGLPTSTVQFQFNKACEDFPLPDIDVFRRRQLAEIQQAKWVLLDILHQHHVVVNEGQIVKREVANPFGGEPEFVELEDSDPLIRVSMALKALWDRESKLLGGDAPIQVETTNRHVHFSVEGIDVNELR